MQCNIIVLAIVIPWTLVRGGGNDQQIKYDVDEVEQLFYKIKTQLDQIPPGEMTVDDQRRIEQMFQNFPDEYSEAKEYLKQEMRKRQKNDNRALPQLGVPVEIATPVRQTENTQIVDNKIPQISDKNKLHKVAVESGDDNQILKSKGISFGDQPTEKREQLPQTDTRTATTTNNEIQPTQGNTPTLKPALKNNAAQEDKHHTGRRLIFADNLNKPLETVRTFSKTSSPSEYESEDPLYNHQESKVETVGPPKELPDQTLNRINSNQEEKENTHPAPAKMAFKLPEVKLSSTEKGRLERAKTLWTITNSQKSSETVSTGQINSKKEDREITPKELVKLPHKSDHSKPSITVNKRKRKVIRKKETFRELTDEEKNVLKWANFPLKNYWKTNVDVEEEVTDEEE